MRYLFQYRREQRVDFEIEADNESEAFGLAETVVEVGFKLDSIDDESDDPGEWDLIEEDDDFTEWDLSLNASQRNDARGQGSSPRLCLGHACACIEADEECGPR